ncbi:MAG: MgtC/SapB family protein [Candidatus Altimarinota bacterium]
MGIELDINQTILKLFVATVVGGVIGLEREKNKQASKEHGPIGIRTEILFSIFGAISILLSQISNGAIFFFCFLTAVIFLCFPMIWSVKQNSHLNIKTSLSSIIAFLLGSLSMLGEIRLALVTAIAVTLILSMKYVFTRAASTISYTEIIDGLKFIIIAFIILPFLPNQAYDVQVLAYLQIGPEMFVDPVNMLATCEPVACDVLNPYRIWLLIVVISGINFLGYILVKAFGQNKGYSFTGLIGGFYSSTVTSLTLSSISKTQTHLKAPFIAGITLACATSFFKMFILIKALNNQLFDRIVPGMLAMFFYLLLTGALVYAISNRKHKESKKTKNLEKASKKIIEIKSPLNLGKAFKLAAIVVTTLILANLILTFADINWYYILAALMAFFAVDDPIIVSTSEIAGKAIGLDVAKNIILGVIYLNMLQKVATMYFFGNRKLTKSLALIFGGLLLVTISALLYL